MFSKFSLTFNSFFLQDAEKQDENDSNNSQQVNVL